MHLDMDKLIQPLMDLIQVKIFTKQIVIAFRILTHFQKIKI